MNKYEPTFWEENITRAWTEQHNIPAVLHKMLGSNGTGTVVYVTNLLPKFKRSGVDVIAELRLQIPLQYSGEAKQSIFTQCGDDEKTRELLKKESLFYENEREKLQDSCEFSVQVYKEENEDNASYHIRMNVTAPFWGAKSATTKASPETPVALEFTPLKSGKFSWKKVTKKSKVLAGLPTTIQINSILLKETTHKLERDRYSERIPARAHYHFRRGERGVGTAFTGFAGVKIQERTHTLLDRFRVLTRFPPSLDDEFGVKHTKQMEDKALPCKEIAHAILSIGRSSFNAWTKDHHDGEMSSVVSSSAGGGRAAVEDDDDESTAGSSVTGGAGSGDDDIHSVSTELADPPLPEMPAAPPVAVVDHKSSATRTLSWILGRIVREDVSQEVAMQVQVLLDQAAALLKQ